MSGGKGQSSSQTNQASTYQPNPQAMGYINQALGRAGQTSNLPFSIPQAPVAGFSPQQQQAFNLVGNAQGQAQPYYDQANQYFAKSAQGPDVSQFFNPYAGAVTANLKDIFGQQMNDTTGRLTQAAGGVGADRIGVGQSELAKQQGLTAGQTMANLYAPSLSAAMQQQQMLQGAGYGTAALGSASQNAALSGANALLGTGGLQQQLSQAQMNSPYQQQVAQAAFPYQQSQFFSGAVGALAPGLGGTTTGQGNTTNNPAQPSMLSQILGLGTAGAGIYGGFGGFNGGKGSSPAYGGDGTFGSGNGVYGGSSSNPLSGLSASDYGGGFARGGSTNPYRYDEGGTVSDDPGMLESLARYIHNGRDHGQRAFYNQTRAGLYNSETAPEEGSTYGGLGHGLKIRRQLDAMDAKRISDAVPRGYDEGGTVSDQPIDISAHSIIPTEQLHPIQPHIPQLNLNPPAQSQSSSGSNPLGDIASIAKVAMMFAKRGGRIDPKKFDGYDRNAYAAGGDVDDDSPATFDERFPYRMPSAGAVDNWRDGSPAMAFSGEEGPAAIPAVRAVRAAGAGAAPARVAASGPQELSPYSASPAAPPEAISERANRDTGFTGSPWAALTAAGLGMMAGTSPFAAANIGQGGLAGLKTLETQRAASQKDETIDQATRRLAQEARFHEDQYARMTPYQKVQLAQQNRPYQEMTAYQRAQVDKEKYVPAGSIMTAEGLHPAVMETGTGRIIDSVTGEPPVKTDKITPKDGNKVPASTIDLISDGIKSGHQPPTLTGLFGASPAVRAKLEEGGFDLAKAQMEWTRAQKQIATLGGPQMTRFVGLAGSVDKTIDEVRELSKQMKNSGVPLLNKAKLAEYMQLEGNSEKGQLAARYIASVNTLKEEFANLANGGYAPTEPAWNLANEQINGNYGVQQLGASLDEIQRLVRYRIQGVPGLEKLGPGAANRYTGADGSNNPAAPTPSVNPATAGKPPTVTQNGHVYNLQPDGSYK